MPRKTAREGKKLSKAAAKLRLLKSLRCTTRYEKRAWAAGATLVAGVDEVGRGSQITVGGSVCTGAPVETICRRAREVDAEIGRAHV